MTLRPISAVLLLSLVPIAAPAADAIPPISRVLPPEGLEIPADVRTRLETGLAAAKKRLETATEQFGRTPAATRDRADIDIFLKAVEFALLHREFYTPKDFEKADWALTEANQRIDDWNPLLANRSRGPRLWPWSSSTGTVVRGYQSTIDGSAQPYGLVIPQGHDFEKPCPLYVWLHGRGDKSTDIHFLYERATRAGQITPSGAIVLHAFGRQCVGYKSAGQVDVHEAVASVKSRYNIDPDRIVLIGFSMGGAGAWQVGAHSASQWVAVSPGAGFVDVARYQRVTPDKYPPWYEQKLWGLNDVPDYVRNLFNTSVIAYSGELDKQREAAVIMEEAFKKEGRELTHLIGPGVEHKYEPATLAELLKRLAVVVEKGREEFPAEAHLQTRTLAHPIESWIVAERLEEHWTDSRIDAVRSENKLDVQTKNIAQFQLTVPGDGKNFQFMIDGQSLPPGENGQGLAAAFSGFVNAKNRSARTRATFVKHDSKWQWVPLAASRQSSSEIAKQPGVQGPIDDAFNSTFIVVTPSGKSKNPRFQAWVDFELAHFRDRWRALMRGEPQMRKDTELTSEDERYNLILWGDPDSNSAIARLVEKAPVSFKDGKWTFGQQGFDGNQFVPALVYPRLVNVRPGSAALVFAKRYIVLNSGLTFREAHDRTNSLQNPKLPDWAIIDLSEPPDARAPGRIHDADFFDEHWQLKRQPKAP